MKATWKGVSRFAVNGEPLLVVTLRQEHELVVSPTQIDKFIEKTGQLFEQGEISEEVARTWTLEFQAIAGLLHSLADSTKTIRSAALETGWQEWPASSITDLLPVLREAFGSKAFFSLKGQVPNYSLSYQFGTSVRDFPLQPTELQSAARYLAAITEREIESAAAEVRAQQISATDAALAVGVVAAGTVVVVGAAYGVAVGIGLVASGAVTAAEVMSFVTAASAAVGAGATATQCYQQQQEAERKRQEQEAEKQREAKEVFHRDATRVREVGGGGPAWEGGMARGGMVA